jgi:hypothetical protein
MPRARHGQHCRSHEDERQRRAWAREGEARQRKDAGADELADLDADQGHKGDGPFQVRPWVVPREPPWSTSTASEAKAV